jgi:hypothetical protein
VSLQNRQTSNRQKSRSGKNQASNNYEYRSNITQMRTTVGSHCSLSSHLTSSFINIHKRKSLLSLLSHSRSLSHSLCLSLSFLHMAKTPNSCTPHLITSIQIKWNFTHTHTACTKSITSLGKFHSGRTNSLCYSESLKFVNAMEN